MLTFVGYPYLLRVGIIIIIAIIIIVSLGFKVHTRGTLAGSH